MLAALYSMVNQNTKHQEVAEPQEVDSTEPLEDFVIVVQPPVGYKCSPSSLCINATGERVYCSVNGCTCPVSVTKGSLLTLSREFNKNQTVFPLCDFHERTHKEYSGFPTTTLPSVGSDASPPPYPSDDEEEEMPIGPLGRRF